MKEEKNNQYNELKELLKNLPQVDAPDNFELNLMTKIQNQNFGLNSAQKRKWFSWALTPAIAFAATVFLVFFFIGNNNLNNNDSFDTLPQLINNSDVAEVTRPTMIKPDKRDKINRVTQGNNKQKNIKPYPFDKNSSLSLDDYLHSESVSHAGNNSQLAASQRSSNSVFDGFFLREVKRFAKEDSLKKTDSLSNSKSKNK